MYGTCTVGPLLYFGSKFDIKRIDCLICWIIDNFNRITRINNLSLFQIMETTSSEVKNEFALSFGNGGQEGNTNERGQPGDGMVRLGRVGCLRRDEKVDSA
jgi:hypothetical protein